MEDPMHHRLSLVSIALFATALCPGQTKHTLRYRFQPGAVGWQQMDQQMSMVMTVAGKETTNETTESIWTEVKVAEVKEDVAVLHTRCARITAKSDSPMMKVDYDSDIPGSKPGPMKDLASLVGAKHMARVTATGKVLELQVSEESTGIADTVLASLKQSFEQSYVALPEAPTAIGETWQSEFAMPMEQMGSLKVKVVNKLIDVRGTVMTVEQTMTMDLSELDLPKGMTMEVDKATGSVQFDLERPTPIAGAMQMVMKMGMGGAPMTMRMTISSKQVEAPAEKAPVAPTGK
jgi:hypothetical protein